MLLIPRSALAFNLGMVLALPVPSIAVAREQPDPVTATRGEAVLYAEVSQEDLRERFLRARARMNQEAPDSPTPQPARPTPTPKPKSTPPPAASTPRPEPTPPPGPTPQERRTPRPSRGEAAPGKKREAAPIVIQKPGDIEPSDDDAGLGASPPKEATFWQRVFGSRKSREPRYRFLTPAIQREIDRPAIRKGRWKYIVVHNSGSRSGNASIFDYYHRKVRKMRNGMAYHFVIGNGTKSGDGRIELGDRWRRQLNGGHVASDYLNDIAIGICLVGDFNRDLPTESQLVALKELIGHLRKIAGNARRKQPVVRGHRDINPRPTDCPGDRWMRTGWLKEEFY